MQRIVLNLSGKQVQKIVLDTNLYGTDIITIAMATTENTIAFASDLDQRQALPGVSQAGNMFSCLNLENFALLMTSMLDLQFLTVEDNTKIQAILPTIQRKLSQKSTIVSDLTPAQFSYVGHIVDIYLDEIAQYSHSYRDMVDMLRFAFSGFCAENKVNIENFLMSRGISHQAFVNIQSLSEIIFGFAGIEDELCRHGFLPHLFAIRNAVNDQCMNRLVDRHQGLDEESQFMMIISTYYQRFGLANPFLDHEALLRAALAGKESLPDYCVEPQLKFAVEVTLQYMGVRKNGPEREYEILYRLGKGLQSALISSFLNPVYAVNPLWLAINNHDVKQLKQLLKDGVNIYTPCVRHSYNPGMFANEKLSALQFALACYERHGKPTHPSATIVKILARAGGAINMDLSRFSPAACSVIETEALAVGAIFPAAFEKKPVMNVQDLLQRVLPGNYKSVGIALHKAMKHFIQHSKEFQILSAHVAVVLYVQDILKNHDNEILESLLEQNYERALRSACQLPDHDEATRIAKALIIRRKALNINLHATSRSNQKTAYDLASERGHEDLIQFLNQEFDVDVAMRKKEHVAEYRPRK